MLSKISSIIISIGRISSWVILPIIMIIVLSVLFSAMKVGTIIEWGKPIFLLGDKLTIASLSDMQWYLFGVIVMLPLAGCLLEDKHVRVDFIRVKLGSKLQNILELLGHGLFMIPFCWVILFHSYSFAVRAYLTGEGSDYDGLYDRFLVKGLIPIGIFLLAFATLILMIKIVIKLKKGSQTYD